RPEMVAETEGGVPVDGGRRAGGVVAERVGHHVRGRVHHPARGGPVDGRPRHRLAQCVRAAGQIDPHSCGTSILRPSADERRPSSASCTPRAPEAKSYGNGASSRTWRTNSSHWILKPLSNSALSGTSCQSSRKRAVTGRSGFQTGF